MKKKVKRVIIPKSDKTPKISPDDKVEMLPPSPISGHSLPTSTLWPKGVVQNPGGAPKGKRVTTWLAELGDMDPSDWPDPNRKGLPANARIALAQLRRAMDQLDGLPAAAWAADRVEGGVDRTVHLTHKQDPTMSLEDAAKMVKKLEQEKGPADF